MIGLGHCPEDGLAWLALADALEEQGEPDRAELVRLRERLRMWPTDHRRDGWEARLRELLAAGVRPAGPKLILDLTRDVSLTMALIPPGRFLMGSPDTEAQRRDDEVRHEVEITHPFYLGIHPVTQGQWHAVMDSNPSYFKGENRPVETVSWDDCRKFCEGLSRRDGKSYRLPTEAEWEYACRAGTSTPFHFGASLSPTQANFNGDYPYGGGAEGAFLGGTSEIGSYPPNAWGLHDMHGNVWEWCADWYGKEGEHSSDPTVPSEVVATATSANYADQPVAIGMYRLGGIGAAASDLPAEGGVVLRGGCWGYNSGHCRSAMRSRLNPYDRGALCGFRLAADI